MAHLELTAKLPANPLPQGSNPARPRRSAFHPSLGAIRPVLDVDAPTPGGENAYASGGAAHSDPNTAVRPRPPKFGAALASESNAQARRTQATHVTSHLNPWIPVPWVHKAPPALPPEATGTDLEAQALQERASLPVHRVCSSPGTVTLKAPVEALSRASVGLVVCINLLDGPMLDALDARAFETVMTTLAQSKHIVHWHYNRYDSLSRLNPLPWARSTTLSGTSALFLHLMAQKDVETAERVMCNKPIEIALELAQTIPELFTLQLLGRVFGAFVPEVTKTHNDATLDENDQLGALAALVQGFLSVHVNADADRLETWTTTLMQRFEDSGFEPTSANVGLMAGAILAGNLRYGAAITAQDTAFKSYIWFCVGLAFAATSFVTDTNIDGGLSLGAFFVGLAFDRYFPVRDLSLDINRLEGKLRTKMLKVEMFKNAYENTEMMAWIDNVKKCNGF